MEFPELRFFLRLIVRLIDRRFLGDERHLIEVLLPCHPFF